MKNVKAKVPKQAPLSKEVRAKPRENHGPGGYRPGSGRKRRAYEAEGDGFTPDQRAWIDATAGASPIASREAAKAGAEILATILMRARRLRLLMRAEADTGEDHDRFAASERNFWKGYEVLQIADPPPPKDPFADDEPAKPAEAPAPAKRDPLLEEIAE